MALIQSLADAIERQETSRVGPGSNAYNNPGNLRDVWQVDHWWLWNQFDHTAAAFPIFPDYATGRAALENDLSIKISRGMTLRQIINAWAPVGSGEGNDPVTYLAHVMQWTSLPADVPLNQFGVENGATPGGGDILGMPPLGQGQASQIILVSLVLGILYAVVD